MSWTQSYPTQRVEGNDTVVVMTIKQAQDINTVFANQKQEINQLKQDIKGVMSVGDSLATYSFRLKHSSVEEQRLAVQKVQNEATLTENKLKSRLARKNDQFLGITLSYFILRQAWLWGLFTL